MAYAPNVYLSKDKKFLFFLYAGKEYWTRVIGHEYTLQTVDSLEARLIKVTGAAYYIPRY